MAKFPRFKRLWKKSDSGLVRKIRTRKILMYSGIAILLIFFGIAITTNMFNGGQITKASISQSGDSITLSGGNFSLDKLGNIYQDPGIEIYNYYATTTKMDPSYYAYLFDPTGVQITPTTNLTIANSANLIVDKTLKANNITLRTGGKISAPASNRIGNVNTPIYDADYWGIRFTGFIKISPHKRYWLAATDGRLDDALAVEVSASSQINDATSWSVVYSDTNFNGWGADKNTALSQFDDDAASYTLLTNDTDNNIYVPIRISMAEVTGVARLSLSKRECPESSWSCDNAKIVTTDEVFGIKDNGTVNTLAAKKMNFEYFINKNRTEYMTRTFSNGVMTVAKSNANLDDDFVGYGESDGLAGEVDYFWSQDETIRPTNPLSDVRPLVEGRYISNMVEEATENVRLLTDCVRRESGGISITVAGKLDIQSSASGIDVTGRGYPGAVAGLNDYGDRFDWTQNRGGSLTKSGAPGGGYGTKVNHITIPFLFLDYYNWAWNNGEGAGGSHAGQGANRDTRLSKSETYGSIMEADTMGSGGGASGEDNPRWQGSGGNGGGSVQIIAAEVDISKANAIVAKGTPGICTGESYGWVNTGGSGGSIKLSTTTLNVNTPATIFSVKGGSYNESTINQYKPRDLTNFSAGGGGYILVTIYSSNLATEALLNQLDVTGGDSSTDNGVGGSGQKRVMAPSITPGYKKYLTAVERAGSLSTSYNPYALQQGDIIKVTIQVDALAANSKIEDEALETPYAGTDHFVCEPIESTIGSTYSSSHQVTDLTISPTETIKKVTWTALAGGNNARFYYNCRVGLQ